MIATGKNHAPHARVERQYSPAVEQFSYSWAAMPPLVPQPVKGPNGPQTKPGAAAVNARSGARSFDPVETVEKTR